MVTGMRPMVVLPQRLFVGLDVYVMLAIPLFTFAGYLMEQGGLSARLVAAVETVFGRVRGSAGTITIVCCAIFAALTGSGPATVAAIGAVMLPALLHSGYSKGTAAGMLAAGGALGPIIPPSIVMIVYGSTMNISIADMFVGGILPGILIAMLYIIVNQVIVWRKNIDTEKKVFTFGEMASAIFKAIPVLMLPVIVLGGIYGGIFTPTEAATVCVVYSILLGAGYRTLNFGTLLTAMKKTVITASTVAVIVGISNAFCWLLAAAKIPQEFTNVVVPMIGSQTVYLFVLVGILLVVGCVMDALPSVIILAPLLVPVGMELGLDPLYLGVLFCIVLIVGLITPPFGINLFTAVATTNTPFAEVTRGAIPFIVVSVLACFIFAFFPNIILFLPNLMR
jgi:C4-dicarboxylate transporter DctM subunit